MRLPTVNASDPQAHGANRAPLQKVCGACGEKIACSASLGDCWCEGVNLTSAELADFRACYADCLCPGCLAATAAKNPNEKEDE
ncbi:MAG: cysteine-rich CWC family protein [Candidatus Acidiferrales bacterium]